jgi:hypothetical protein
MSTLQEIEAAIPKLTPQEIVRLQAWLDDYCEDRLELTDEVKTALDEARRDIEQGRYRAGGGSHANATNGRQDEQDLQDGSKFCLGSVTVMRR